MTVATHGEDLVIDKALSRAGRNLETGYAVEVGAAAGKDRSNTHHLEERGWKVLCIEPNPLYYERLVKRRKLVYPLACGAKHEDWAQFTVMQQAPHEDDVAYESGSALKPRYDLMDRVGSAGAALGPQMVFPVRVETLNWCLEHAGFPWLDVVSIDTEGGEWEVLEGFDVAKWNPIVVVIENWLEEPRMRDYFRDLGYALIERIVWNDIYERKGKDALRKASG